MSTKAIESVEEESSFTNIPVDALLGLEINNVVCFATEATIIELDLGAYRKDVEVPEDFKAGRYFTLSIPYGSDNFLYCQARSTVAVTSEFFTKERKTENLNDVFSPAEPIADLFKDIEPDFHWDVFPTSFGERAMRQTAFGTVSIDKVMQETGNTYIVNLPRSLEKAINLDYITKMEDQVKFILNFGFNDISRKIETDVRDKIWESFKWNPSDN